MRRSATLALLLLSLGCDKPALGDKACRMKCNEVRTACHARCPEPVACGSRCDDAHQRCLKGCA
ncbi:MAG: hypothetical protein IT374_02965 [Polyangiaceae bacterium]|nr:hypothetical protein [Polyangiaceae bacterium]